MTRLLVIMGSGETSPTMVGTHREVFARLGPDAPAVLLDTPFGFQENADDIAAKAVAYFARSVGRTVQVAGFRRSDGADRLARESALAAIARARWVFAGPGSPTYTLRQWAGTEIPGLLADKLRRGGAVTFASAAALTLGVRTVPVYEIYKSGADPEWADGLDLLAGAGLRAAVIPHYDNAEGGNHDTRYCYLGERRLRILERQLPDDAFVLGVDEHTGVVLDLDAASATVVGLGGVTVRRHGRSSVIPTSSTVSIASLVDLAMGVGKSLPATAAAGAPEVGPVANRATPLMAAIGEQASAFDAALGRRDVDGAVRAILELDAALTGWAADTLQSDEPERGRAVLRRMIVELGELAKVGARDPRQAVAPFVDQLLAVRSGARAAGRFGDADAIRDGLEAAGVEVRDGPAGTDWSLRRPLLS